MKDMRELFTWHLTWVSTHLGWYVRHEATCLDCGTLRKLCDAMQNKTVRHYMAQMQSFDHTCHWIAFLVQYDFNYHSLTEDNAAAFKKRRFDVLMPTLYAQTGKVSMLPDLSKRQRIAAVCSVETLIDVGWISFA